MLEDYEGKVLFVYKDFPLTNLHPNAVKVAEAAHCAGDQGMFWEYGDILFASEIDSEDENLKQYAEQLGLNITSSEQCLDSGKYT